MATLPLFRRHHVNVRPPVGNVWCAVSTLLGVDWAYVAGPGRKRRQIEARTIYARLLRDLCGMSYPEIAEKVFPRQAGHTGALEAVTRSHQPEYADLLARAAKLLDAQGGGQ